MANFEIGHLIETGYEIGHYRIAPDAFPAKLRTKLTGSMVALPPQTITTTELPLYFGLTPPEIVYAFLFAGIGK
jgi:hypothetical protein